MDNSTTDQILNLIEKSKNILLLTHAKADCDGLGAMLSLHSVLKELGKEVTAVTNDPPSENLSFLPSINIIKNSLLSAKDFIITLDVTNTPVSKIKYNLEDDNKVNIIISPKSGAFSEKDISFQQGGNKYDLIIVLDAGSLDHLGEIYDRNTEMFFETPVINIDHHSSNTDFGRVNAVDVVAASTTEVLFGILKRMEEKYSKKLITEDIATLLLAGIITDTGSFQHANTSPRSMETSAQLLDLGARQQEIIKNIYKTKKLSTLKLWGIVLSKVQVDPVYRIVWSGITKEDLQESGASSEESENIIDDLLTNAPGAEVTILIKHNDEGYISVSMRSTTNSVDVGKICAEMGGGGHVRAAGYKVKDGQPFDQVVSKILDKVRKYQAERLNIHPENISSAAVPAQPEPEKKPDQEGAPEPAAENQPKKITYLDFKSPGGIEKKEESKKPEAAEIKESKAAEKTEEKKETKPFPKKPFNKNNNQAKQENRQKDYKTPKPHVPFKPAVKQVEPPKPEPVQPAPKPAAAQAQPEVKPADIPKPKTEAQPEPAPQPVPQPVSKPQPEQPAPQQKTETPTTTPATAAQPPAPKAEMVTPPVIETPEPAPAQPATPKEPAAQDKPPAEPPKPEPQMEEAPQIPDWLKDE